MSHGAQTEEVHVFAAASLVDVLNELAPKFEAATGIKPVYNFAASSLLARQIEAGAPADVFLSADEAKMNQLASKNLILADSRKDLLGNSLTIVVPKESALQITTPRDLLKPEVKFIATGEPKTVPVGIYAQEYFTKLGIWGDLEKKLIPSESVRAALAAVESGSADAGIVYKTDALASHKVKVAYEVPVSEGPKIIYPVAALKDSPSHPGAQKFLEFLSSDTARQAFLRYGFLTPTGN